MEEQTAHTGSLQVREFARERDRAVEIYLDCAVPHDGEPWLEEAIDCCAFLAWRLADQGAAIRFQTQGYSMRVPEQGDVYAILRYLALVQPMADRARQAPLDEQSFQIVFSPDPEPLALAGWTPARLLRPGDSAFAAAPKEA